MGTTLYLPMYQNKQLYLSVYMENVKRPGDNLILVHVPELNGVIQARE